MSAAGSACFQAAASMLPGVLKPFPERLHPAGDKEASCNSPMALGCDLRLTRLVVPGLQGPDDDTLVPFSHKLQLGMRLLQLREALCQQGVLRMSGPSGQACRPAQVEAACHELGMLTTTQACPLEHHVTRLQGCSAGLNGCRRSWRGL